MDTSLNILREIAEDREDWCTAVHGVAKLEHDWATEQQNLWIEFKKHLRENELYGSVHLYWTRTERMSPVTCGWSTNRSSLLSTFHGLSQKQHWITGQDSEHQTKHGVRVHLSHWFSNFRAHQNHLEDLVAQDCRALFQSFWTRRTGAQVSGPGGLEPEFLDQEDWSLRTISNKFPSNADAAIMGTPWGPLVYMIHWALPCLLV